MIFKKIRQIIFTFFIAALGAFSFNYFSLPIPWILGPLSFILITKLISKKNTQLPPAFRDVGLMIIGIYFGLSFTTTTLETIIPYMIPFLLSTILLLTVSILLSIFITKFIELDPITSVFGSIPGGLSEMVAASESLSANSAMVTILQTIRLLTVVFTIPFLVLHMFSNTPASSEAAVSSLHIVGGIHYLWFLLAMFVGWLIRNHFPAAHVLGPLIVIASLSVFGVSLPPLSPNVLIAAQITVGISMGNKILIRDLKLAGKYGGYYFVLSLVLILTSFGIGYLFSSLSSLSLSTAILSLAPGGMVEMVLTAKSIGADSAVVSALQLIRLLFIILVVPSFLKFIFSKSKSKGTIVNNSAGV
ncbi:AbrB family transcriptional regulator [Bacillus sp. PS06]|uniref:AbrB family transcriptional regulator n=1 Tax=Bacillus sp. PS06 TaxID=2764176 RepID=UPI00177B122A|nr:AbrB family transcriptional regulator [Bacillus sp. PS06]MBD8068511.1 AbrB family transcriptional regulator [Bacillus sp. PS06]